MTDPLATDDDFDPDERALCPDDACIGVLDRTGHCKVCGRQGTEAAAPEEPVAPDLTLGTPAVDPSAAADDAAAADNAAASDDFVDRRLCADPGCIGVLDATGRCKECGRGADPP